MTGPTLPCGWCGTSNRDLSNTNCVNCGGPLPPPPTLPRDELGVEPPPVPRVIPAPYRRRVLYWKNVNVIIGMAFTIVFCWSIIFPIIGIPLWYFGRKKALARLEALERGQAAPARLVSVRLDSSIQMNGRSPWKILYTFDTAQGIKEGWVHAWEALHSRREEGEAFWVVYLPDDPDRNTPWPPVR